MNIQGLIERYEKFKASKKKMTSVDLVLKDLRSLDEPEPLPFKLKDVVRRIRGFDPTTQTRWLNDILKELGNDYGSMKYREGYEQGKLEGAWVGNQLKDADKIRQELNKPVIPQFVADWYEENKDDFEFNVWDWIAFRNEPEKLENKELNSWINDGEGNPIQTLVNMHQFGYEVEKEKRYKIALLNRNDGTLYLVNRNANVSDKYGRFSPVVLFFTKETKFSEQCYELTKKDVVSNGFGWVFDCPGVEVEEVE